MYGHVVNQRRRLLTGSRHEITYISACIIDRNEIMFVYVNTNSASKMAAIGNVVFGQSLIYHAQFAMISTISVNIAVA